MIGFFIVQSLLMIYAYLLGVAIMGYCNNGNKFQVSLLFNSGALVMLIIACLTLHWLNFVLLIIVVVALWFKSKQ